MKALMFEVYAAAARQMVTFNPSHVIVVYPMPDGQRVLRLLDGSTVMLNAHQWREARRLAFDTVALSPPPAPRKQPAPAKRAAPKRRRVVPRVAHGRR